MSKVHIWHMTEEERLTYIEKHPIKPNPEAKKGRIKDFQWRGEKGAASRWGDTGR